MTSATARPARPDPTDADLARSIAGGDRDAFTVVMRRHNRTLFRVARSILKDDAEAEDAVQEAYLQAYRAINTFRGDAKLSTWLVRIVANESFARRRKRARRAEVIPLGGDPIEPDDPVADPSLHAQTEQPERAALRAETRRLLEAKIDQLPDAFRAVFVLRAIEDMSVEETAQCLGIPDATVRTRYFRAKGLLREALAREIDFAFEETFAFAGDRCDRIVAGVWARLDAAAPGGS